VISPSDVERRIVAALPGARVSVRDLTGTADHYAIDVTSERFDGLGSLQRHRLVHAALKDVLGGALHAVELTTRTPTEAP
jgi:stress-induced morphogen